VKVSDISKNWQGTCSSPEVLVQMLEIVQTSLSVNESLIIFVQFALLALDI
jgi:hypothetical protein